MHSLIAKGLGLFFTVGVSTASGAVMTFDRYANDSPKLWGVEIGPDVHEDDFTIRSCSSRCGVDSLVAFSRNDSKQADPGGATVVAWHNDLTLRLSRDDGGMFDFYSIDIADLYNVQSFGTVVEFNFIRPGGVGTVRTARVTVPRGLQTFVFDERDVSVVTFRGLGTGGIGQFDNVRLDEYSVPEPGSFALALAAIALGAVSCRARLQ